MSRGRWICQLCLLARWDSLERVDRIVRKRHRSVQRRSSSFDNCSIVVLCENTAILVIQSNRDSNRWNIWNGILTNVSTNHRYIFRQLRHFRSFDKIVLSANKNIRKSSTSRGETALQQPSWHFPRVRVVETQRKGESKVPGGQLRRSIYRIARRRARVGSRARSREERRGECGSHWCSREERPTRDGRTGKEGPGRRRDRPYTSSGGRRGFPLMFDGCVWAGFGRRSVREECEDA